MLLLQAISEDLLSLILSNLEQHDLFIVCQVCKFFYAISRPMLYRNLKFTHTSGQGPNIALGRLCLVLSINPQLPEYLRSLSLAKEAPSLLSKNLVEKKISFPKLRILSLLRAQKLCMAELKTMLVSTPNLEALECDFELEAKGYSGPPTYLDCERLRDSILPVRSTLRSLKLSLDFVAYVALEVDAGGSDEYRDPWGIKGAMGSLTAFEKLDVLEVPIAVLLGWSADTDSMLSHILPPSLSTLVLRHDLDSFWAYEWNEHATVLKAEEFLQYRTKTPISTSLSFIIKYSMSSLTEPESASETIRLQELQAIYSGPSVSFRIELTS